MTPRLIFVVNDIGFFVSHRLPIGRVARARGYEVHLAAGRPTVGLPHATGGKTVSLNSRYRELRARVAADGVIYHPVDFSRGSISVPSEIRMLGQLRDIFKRVEPDIVHNVTARSVMAGGLLARLQRVDALVNAVSGLGRLRTAEGLDRRIIETLVTVGFRLSCGHPNSRVIVQNHADEQFLLQRGIAQSRACIRIPGSGVPTDQFRPDPDDDRDLVLFAGRLLRSKGVGDFRELASRLRRIHGDVRFVIVGAPDTANDDAVAVEQLEAWNARGTVEWWGYRENMSQIYQRTRVVCVPSTYGEGIPRVLIEAFASACAVVAYDIPGIRDVVNDSSNGLLIPAGDVDGMTRAVHRLLENREFSDSLGRQARRDAVKRYSLDRVVNDHLEVYADLLAHLRR